MITSPLISIITPSFNQSQYLEKTINSIINQDYLRIEFFLFDGESKDDSLKIINKYRNQISFFSSEKDSGQSNAINKGLKKCTGEIINWINSDDLLLPGSLDIIAKCFLDNPETDFFYGDTVIIDQFDRPVYTLLSLPFDANILKYGGNLFAQPSCFFHRSVLEKIGYLNEDLHWAMDYEFWMRALHAGCNFTQIPHTISAFRIHNQSKSVSNHKKIQDEYFYSFSEIFYGESSINNKENKNIFRFLKLLYRVIRVLKLAFYRKAFSIFQYSKAVKKISRS
jgi:glycosyltransferase involved in cell wall biosynthesis